LEDYLNKRWRDTHWQTTTYENNVKIKDNNWDLYQQLEDLNNK
jgi:hypothetical protein